MPHSAGSPGRSETARQVVARVHERLTRAGFAVPVQLWDGSRLGPDGGGYRLVLNHPAALRSMLWPPVELHCGEAYICDDIDVDGSMIEALRQFADHRATVLGPGQRTGLLTDLVRLPAPRRHDLPRRARLAGRRHTRRRDRQAIGHHYEVGNDFYRLYLDDRLVYSCAYFTDDDDDLNRAQLRKLDLICRKLRLEPGQRLLDIGCGWGALLIHAARSYGVHATGVTLSVQQAALARELAEAAGVSDRVEIRVEDYRDVRGSFDAVASVGMFEHVGADQLAGYFRRCFALTAPGGRFLNHGITTGRRDAIREVSKDRSSFLAAYVFPDGALVPAYAAVRHLEQAGFELHDVEQLRPHYARTLTHWVQRLEANRDQARRIAGEQIYRIWRAYMAASVVGFESGDIGVIQMLGSKGAQLPLGRDWMRPTVDVVATGRTANSTR